ncbi:MAG: hypothetical protein CR989_00250 [Flavobacteriales bacterium]|nr:MAG: hypothetical protein CR989_00250 [Flavobacteriales bacterium]
MKYFCAFCVYFFLIGCSPKLTASYKKLSKPEKKWVIFHPFKAKKAAFLSNAALEVTDSIKQLGLIGKDKNGGRLDAFKHGFWMARLSQKIGKKAALRLGKAHEKGNYLDFKNGALEDGQLPDKPSSDMDLYNNNVGVTLGNKYKSYTKKKTVFLLLSALSNGKLKMLKKDDKSNFLTCDGKIIPPDSLLGKWENKKCLTPTY